MLWWALFTAWPLCIGTIACANVHNLSRWACSCSGHIGFELRWNTSLCFRIELRSSGNHSVVPKVSSDGEQPKSSWTIAPGWMGTFQLRCNRLCIPLNPGFGAAVQCYRVLSNPVLSLNIDVLNWVPPVSSYRGCNVTKWNLIIH